jgi:hypothetical protein
MTSGQDSSRGAIVDDSPQDHRGSHTAGGGGQLSQVVILPGPVETEDEDSFFVQESYGTGGLFERLAGGSPGTVLLSRRDLASLDVTLLWSQLDALADDILPDEALSTFSVGAAAGVSVVFSAGYVAWCLRSGALLASAISSLPMWRSFDPLPVLEFWEKRARRGRNEKGQEEESVEELVEGMA